VQLSTEASNRIIVGAGVSQSGERLWAADGAVARIEANLAKKPGQLVVDGGFTTRENIMSMPNRESIFLAR